MKQYQRKIEEYKSLIQKEYIRETAVHTVKERCSDIMNRQDNRRASYFEFLFEQFKFIKKRWWVLQGGILILLWILLVDSDGGAITEGRLGGLTGGYVSDVFGNDHTGNLEESELFSSGN